MKSAPQWMMRRGHIPLHPETRLATDPLHQPGVWLPHAEAVARSQQENSADGVGFALTESDPYFFIDLDECFDGEHWSPLALKICNDFNGAHIELSKSGRGLHIYGKATSIPEHRCKNQELHIELYSKLKFVHVTERSPRGDSEQDCTAALHQLVADYFPPREVDEWDWTVEPREDWDGIEDDDELISQAIQSQSMGAVFGERACFSDLWEAREDVLGASYLDPTGQNPYDRSSADAALAQHLAFWTGCDCERIERLMRQSKLVRDKWDDRGEYYLSRTIINACGMQVEVYQRTRAVSPVADALQQQTAAPITSEPTATTPEEMIKKTGEEMRSGLQILAVTQQLEYFQGCVYIESMDKVFVPGGRLLNRTRFDVIYGGYWFGLDTSNEKTTKSAWEAFTVSMAFDHPKAQEAAFRPDLPPGSIYEKNGVTKTNIYHPLNIPRKQGDPSPFLNHLTKLIPDESDRAIILAFMAACVQHPGKKFQWCPLIQGTEGNGKTLISTVVAEAIGQKYCYFPRANQIDSEFNGWIANKIFIGVEDIYISEKKQHVMEVLKPIITGQIQEIRVMQTDGYCAEVCCNFILNSNHKDALRKTDGDRRYAPFFTAQQTKDDIIRDGMGGDYFPNLYEWLRTDGYAIMAEYLHTYQIPDALNPAVGLHRAPRTSSTAEAIQASLGSIEQSILEAVNEARSGFAGGYISSTALEELLSRMRATRTIPPNKRRDLLLTLGYDYHPHLADGRLNSPSDIDGGRRPRLFVKPDSPAAALTNPLEILKNYQDAQRGLISNPFAEAPHHGT